MSAGANQPPRRGRRVALIAALAALPLVAGGVAWWGQTRARALLTDGDTIREPLSGALRRDVLWQPPRPAGAALNTGDEDYEPKLSWDGQSLFFVRGKAGTNAEIWSARRTADGWADAAPVAAVNSGEDDLGPAPSHDGQTLYFYSNREGTLGGYDIWASHLADEAWQAPANLGPGVNSPFNDYGPAPAPDGKTLYFASNRPAPNGALPDADAWPATVREDLFHRTYDLYSAEISAGGYVGAKPLAALNTSYNEGPPCVSPEGNFLYFASDRLGGQGAFDLYRSWMVRGELRPAMNLGATLNTPANELDPTLGALGFGLYFSSDRTMERAGGPAWGQAGSEKRAPDGPAWEQAGSGKAGAGRGADRDYNIYYSASREVFVETEALPIDWAALWRALGPSLLWALLALLALLLLGYLLGRDLRRGRLGLLARCLIASLMLHALLLLMLSFWRVSAGIAESLGRGGPIRVALIPSASAAGLAEQLNAKIASIDSPVALAAAIEPPKPAMLESRMADAPTEARFETVRSEIAPRPMALDASRTSEAPAPAAAPAEPAASLAARDVSPATIPLPLPAAAERIAAAAPAPLPTPTAADEVVPDHRPAPRVGDESTFVPSAAAALDAPQTRADESAATSGAMVTAAREADAAERVDERAPASRPAIAAREDDAAPVEISLALPGAGTPAPAVAPAAAAIEPAAPAAVEVVAPRPVAAERDASFEPVAARLPAPAHGVTNLLRESLVSTTPARGSGAAELAPAAESAPALRLAPADLGERLPLALSLPSETAPPAESYAQRAPERRSEQLERTGGNPQTEAAVNAALAWLARHQSRDGHWDGTTFDEGCDACGGATSYDVDVAVSGLATLCFLGAGHSHMRDGPYRDTVRKAIDWLVSRQNRDGDLRAGETMYSQGIATIALAEALGMTGDARLREPVERAATFIARARHPRDGGWRYAPGDDGDMSVLGWQVMALKSAATAGAAVSADALVAAQRWIERVESPQAGLLRYQPGQPVTPTMTAEGLFVRTLLGAAVEDPRVRGATLLVTKNPPNWGAATNTYYWYYATLALFHQQGEAWEAWNRALQAELLPRQAREGKAAGSWSPDGEWANIGGRVYQTAICTLMLEVYYRYLPMYAAPPSRGGAGRLVGRVTDARSGAPLEGAVVRLDMSGVAAPEARSSADGSYELAIAAAPQFVAVTAAREGYVPAARNVASELFAGASPRLDFALSPESGGTIALESSPEVHHLGNDRFEGAINSQFQTSSEGVEYAAGFVLSGAQAEAARAGGATLTLLAKGVQCPHEIRVNRRLLRERLANSPAGGEFGEFAARVAKGLLVEGVNSVEIRAVSCNGDLDDFEFVNVQVRLGGSERSGDD